MLLFVATWLYLPRGAEAVELAPPVRVIVLDASASARRQRPDWTAWARSALKAEAQAAKLAAEELAVIVFANEVRRVFGPGSPRALEDRLSGRDGAPLVPSEGAGSDAASRLCDALDAAAGLALAPERAPGRVVLMGVDRATDGDPNPGLGRLARVAELERRELPPCAESDLALVDLELPRSIEAGSPLVAVVTLAHVPGTSSPTAGQLELEIFEGGALRLLRVPLPLTDWTGERRLSIPLGTAVSGLIRVNARVRLGERPDPIPENDFATAVASTRASRVVGVLTGVGVLAPAGAPAGLERVDVTLDDLALVLPSLDALIAVDVSPEDLEARVPDGLLESFVRGGGGWLSTGGWQSLSGWNESVAQRGFQRLLPLEPAPPEGGPRDVVLLLDGSQSMEGEPFEAVRVAAVDLVEAAARSDRVTLRFFTAALQDPVVLKERDAEEQGRAAGREAARALLARTVPRGDTYLMRSLETLLDRRPEDAPPALVIMLSDGRERESPIRPYAERGAELRERLLERRVRLVPIAVGERVELKYMQMLVPDGQRVQLVTELDDLGRLFRREVGGARLVEAEAGGSLSLTVRGGSESLAFEVLGGTAPPPVERFLRARPRAGAEVAWTDDENAPVLALMRVGRGRVAMVTTALNADWASEWMARGQPGASGSAWNAIAPLVRWLARRPVGPEDEPSRAWLDGTTLHVAGLPPSGAASLEARLVREEGALALALEPPLRSAAAGPGELRERSAFISAADRQELLAGAAMGTATLLVEVPGRPGNGETAKAEIALSVALGPAPEFLLLGTPVAAEWFGPEEEGEGAALRSAHAASEGMFTARPSPLAAPVLGLALALLGIWAFLAARARPRAVTKTPRSDGQGGRSFSR